ncbi:hypothetical protein [Methylobacillus flagellatus]|uniref:hypothetical protein n=1 Tax=Methylobacillus flagellatus TaxID=405 RepID=UPI0010F98E8E|nr:hypothetical protein [Methylobacillus flagellatus]
MSPERRRELKLQGKAEVERQSTVRKAQSEAMLPDMLAAIGHTGHPPTDLAKVTAEQLARAKREAWITTKKPIIHRDQLHSEFIPLPDPKLKWQGHPFSYRMCKACGSVLPAIPVFALLHLSSCRCGNLRYVQVLGFKWQLVRKNSMVLPIALFGRSDVAHEAQPILQADA